MGDWVANQGHCMGRDSLSKMSKHKNVRWDLPKQVDSWQQVEVAVLMDIRDELQKLNRLLGCSNFINMPRTLSRIDKRLAKKVKLK